MPHRLAPHIALVGVVVAGSVCTQKSKHSTPDPKIDHRYRLNPGPAYAQMMSAYNRRHYGVGSALLKNPQVVIVHCTYTHDLQGALRIFGESRLGIRRDLKRGGTVNIGIHYMVDLDGRIYSHMPLKYTARHAVGLNYTAIGIENIGLNNSKLTAAQLESNVVLIKMLKRRYPGLRFLIGHFEYNDRSLPHYSLVRSLDPSYTQWKKTDPGRWFMGRLRKRLKPLFPEQTEPKKPQ